MSQFVFQPILHIPLLSLLDTDKIIIFCLLQDIPTYCITLTLLVLCLDRHQSIRHPDPGPLPMRWILALVWVISVALVLPYMAYITHVDLSVSAFRWTPSVILLMHLGLGVLRLPHPKLAALLGSNN